MKKGVEIVPEDEYRVTNEDLFEVSSAGNPQDFGKKGGQSSASSKGSANTTMSDDDFPDNKLKGQAFREASQTLYAKKGDRQVGLADFII